MAQFFTKKDNDQRDKDWDLFLRITWSDHLKSVESSVYESPIIHGITSPRSCCSHNFMSEARKKEMSHEYGDIQICACKVCGQDHSAVTIKLEHGGFITTTRVLWDQRPRLRSTK